MMRLVTLACRLVTIVAVALAGCQDNVRTRFPAGLEPLEDNTAPAPAGSGTEVLNMVQGGDELKWVHGRGYLAAAPAKVWAASKRPERVVAACDTSRHTVTVGAEPAYELSFQVHYEVDNVLTVVWDELWRYGTVEGTPEVPVLAMIRYQKVYGSDFIRVLEGSVQILAGARPDVTEVEMIEHLSALGGDHDNLRRSMQHRFDQLRAAVHDETPPSCP